MTMEISNRLPDVDNVTWDAVIMLGLDEYTFTLDLAPFLDVSEVQEAFITEVNDTYDVDHYPVILSLKSILGEY